jgi:hypothetical protein
VLFALIDNTISHSSVLTNHGPQLTASLLANDPAEKYEVELFECVSLSVARLIRVHRSILYTNVAEQGPKPSLAAAAVSIKNHATGAIETFDIPMRAVTSGYYVQFQALCQHLGLHLRPQKFVWSFSNIPSLAKDADSAKEQQHFIHATNHHVFPPPRPRDSSILAHGVRCVIVLILFWWFTLCCIYIPARDGSDETDCETFRQYLQRIRLPTGFVERYLLPLLSTISTCDHETKLSFPASDITLYQKYAVLGRTLKLCGGVEALETKLVEGINVHFNCEVLSVQPQHGQVRLVRRQNNPVGVDSVLSELYTKVVLGVSPDVAVKICEPLSDLLTSVPVTKVTSVAHTDRKVIPSSLGALNFQGSDFIHLRTPTTGQISTEATHAPRPDVFITTNGTTPVDAGCVLRESTFTRVLRTPHSRRIVNSIFEYDESAERSARTPLVEKGSLVWRNGEDGIFLVGSWCWDGMGKCLIVSILCGRKLC